MKKQIIEFVREEYAKRVVEEDDVQKAVAIAIDSLAVGNWQVDSINDVLVIGRCEGCSKYLTQEAIYFIDPEDGIMLCEKCNEEN